MLSNELARAQIQLPQPLSVFCTMKFFKQKMPGRKATLDAVLEYFSLNNVQRDVHGALLGT
jgi:DNA polymerase III epsilon subunit-like protein